MKKKIVGNDLIHDCIITFSFLLWLDRISGRENYYFFFFYILHREKYAMFGFLGLAKIIEDETHSKIVCYV